MKKLAKLASQKIQKTLFGNKEHVKKTSPSGRSPEISRNLQTLLDNILNTIRHYQIGSIKRSIKLRPNARLLLDKG